MQAPSGTPEAVVNRLAEHIGAALRDANVLRRFDEAGLTAAYQAGSALAERVASETEAYARVVRDASIRAE